MRENAQQWHDTMQGAPHRGLKLAGQRFGELTAIRPVDKSSSQGIIWLCRCDCGRVALRLAAALTQSKKRSFGAMCCVCRGELFAGLCAEGRGRRTEGYVALYYMSGSLYGLEHDEATKGKLVEDFERHEMYFADKLAVEPRFSPLELAETLPKTGQRAAFLLPLSGRVWKCSLCLGKFSLGFVCAACRELTCRDCVRLELHRCPLALRSDWSRVMSPQVVVEAWSTGSPQGRCNAHTLTDEDRKLVVETHRHYREKASEQKGQSAYEKGMAAHQKRVREEAEKRLRQIRRKHKWLAEYLEGLS